MKFRSTAVLALCLMLVSINANAGFFFVFIPGRLISSAGDALTGAQGENCVGPNAKVGDTIHFASGNAATIKSISGISSRCLKKELPVRASLEFQYVFSSKAGIEIPDGYQTKPLNELQKARGFLVSASSTTANIQFMVNFRIRNVTTDTSDVAQSIATSLMSSLEDAKTFDEEKLVINGIPAARFIVKGKVKSMFHPEYCYVVTILESDGELLVINAYTPSSDYEKNKIAMQSLAMGIRGLNVRDDQQTSLQSGASQHTIPMQDQPAGVSPSPVNQVSDGVEQDASKFPR